MDLVYEVSKLVLKGFGALCGPGDQKRLAGQVYPCMQEYTDIPYIDDGDKLHLLDVYVPNGVSATDKLPVIIDFHGGGWSYGDKDLIKNHCLHLCEKGFVVFNCSYRLAPDYKIDDQMQDCMAAMNFIKTQLGNYPCDANRIYLVGDSAGGQLASHTAAANLSDDICKAYGMERAGLNVKGVCLISPAAYLQFGFPFDYYLAAAFKDGFKQAPYYKYLNLDACLDAVENYPPTIVFSSLMDVIANVQSVQAYKDLQARGIESKLDFQLHPKLMHEYTIMDPDERHGARALNLISDWFNQHK